mgnify:CR=1 FL=1
MSQTPAPGKIVAVCDVNKASYGYKTEKQFLGREPQRDFVNQSYATKTASGLFKGCDAYADFRDVLARQSFDIRYHELPVAHREGIGDVLADGHHGAAAGHGLADEGQALQGAGHADLLASRDPAAADAHAQEMRARREAARGPGPATVVLRDEHQQPVCRGVDVGSKPRDFFVNTEPDKLCSDLGHQ